MGKLYKPYLGLVSFIFLTFICFMFIQCRQIIKVKKIPRIYFVLIGLLAINTLINLIGALGPELAFDALWYHLTLPKLYLIAHKIHVIPGNLLYYSAMPQLGEMLFTPAVSFIGEIGAKLIQYFFSILCLILVYKTARKLLLPFFVWVCVVIFSTNLVFSWEATTAYIDLIRTFFELTAFFYFIEFIQRRKYKFLYMSAIVIGGAICTKLLAIGSLVIFICLLFLLKTFKETKLNTFLTIHKILPFFIIAVAVSLPWFIYSYLYTGNPIYPFFTLKYPLYTSMELYLSPVRLLSSLRILFTRLADPISPLYLVFTPLVFYHYKKFDIEIKILVWYCAFSILLWYLTPQTGGGRFILPYLPVFSIVCGAAYSFVRDKKLQYTLLILVIITSIITTGYRFIANKKYIPVFLGQQTKSDFLSKNLNFEFGDFYDTDGYFSRTITSKNVVLLYGFHNLYYINFTFVHESWLQKGQQFDYIAVQKETLPERFSNWVKIYENTKTHVAVFAKNEN